jgi:hypothetical protein
MKVRSLFVLTSVLALVGVAPAVAVAKPGGTDRPVKGSTSGTSTADLATGAAASQGTAHVSHFGKATYTLNATFSISGTTLTNEGTATLVAANGDQVFATFTGTATVASPVPAVGATGEGTLVFTITGGTGRFSNATGTLTGAIHQEIVSLVGTTVVLRDTGTLQGRISY